MKKEIAIIIFLVSMAKSSLIASYNFSGNANDGSGNGYNGKVVGAELTTDRFGNENSAYLFDGKGDYIDLPNLQLSGCISISGWFYIIGDYHPNHMAMLGQATSYSERWVFSGSHSEVTWYDRRGQDNAPYAIQESLNLGKWYNLTAVVNSDNNSDLKVKMYLDGAYQGTVSNRLFQGINTGYQIGKFYNEFGWDYSNGKMDDINIYNQELSEGEILALYHSTSVPELNTFLYFSIGLILISVLKFFKISNYYLNKKY